jgi:hypothetical protein
MFSISLLSSTPDIESQISFVARSSINGGILQCGGDSITLMLESIGGIMLVSLATLGSLVNLVHTASQYNGIPLPSPSPFSSEIAKLQQ